MIPKTRTPTHPGEVLLEEFLEELGIPQLRFAETLGITVQRVNEIVKGKRGITPETAWLFSAALGTTPEFWMNLQVQYDLARARPAAKKVPRLRAAG